MKRSFSFSDHSDHPFSRRSSYAYRAAKAVEDVARRMSTVDFSISHIEQHLEREIQREKELPDRTINIIRQSGEKILHSRKILLLVVILNIIDCALVMGELILDIHFIKEMVNIAKHFTFSFITRLQNVFPRMFADVRLEDVHVFYNRILQLGIRLVSGSNTTNYLMTWNNTHLDLNNETLIRDVNLFSEKDVPRYLLNETASTLEEDLAHAFHKTSISILGALTVLTLVKIFCFGTRFFKKKMELLDGLIVITSFVLDLVYIKGLIAYPMEEAVQILAFLIPWRVVRVANSLVMAVTDQAHIKLKMQYKIKKKIVNKLEHANDFNFYYKQVVLALRQLCYDTGVPKQVFHDCVSSVYIPERKKYKEMRYFKKKFSKFQCLGAGSQGRPSIMSAAYGDTDHMTEEKTKPEDDRQAKHEKTGNVDHTHLKSALSSRSDGSDNNNAVPRHMSLANTMSNPSVHFNLGSDDSESDSDVDDTLFVSEILRKYSD